MASVSAESPPLAAVRARAAALAPTAKWLPVVAITLLAGVLRLVSLAGSSTNSFYDAAVRSMGESWHNFFFAAFEPAAGTSIDKPPVDLWLQVASVKLFGLGPTALILPQALAATLAVPLLYDLVRRLFGRPAGLAAALCLAVLPISVMTARSDTMDSLMMALNVLAAWLVVRSAQSGRLAPLIWAGAVMGLSFEVKLLEALLALPALVTLYLLAAPIPLRARALRLFASLAVFVVVALAWPTLVSIAPAHSRPYAIGSTNGSVWNAIFIYNGKDRLNPPKYALAPPPRLPAAAAVPLPSAALLSSLQSNGDSPSVLRLFELGGYHYGQDLGVGLIGAFAFGGLALLAAVLASLQAATTARRQRLAGAAPIERRGLALTPKAGAAAVAIWLLVCFAIFSNQHGVLRSRYLEAISPAVAIAMGAGVAVCVRNALRSGLALAGLAAAVLVVTLYGLDVSSSDAVTRAITIAAAVAGVLAAAAAWAMGRREPVSRVPRAALALAAGALCLVTLLAPALARSANLVSAHASDAGSTSQLSRTGTNRVSAYLRGHTRGVFYEAAAYGYPQAAPLVVRDGRPVLVLMSFHSPVVSIPQLARQVARGRVRYAVIQGHCGYDPLPRLGDCPGHGALAAPAQRRRDPGGRDRRPRRAAADRLTRSVRERDELRGRARHGQREHSAACLDASEPPGVPAAAGRDGTPTEANAARGPDRAAGEREHAAAAIPGSDRDPQPRPAAAAVDDQQLERSGRTEPRRDRGVGGRLRSRHRQRAATREP